jgi:glucosamine--fructose-6-phosphate aminotransferase (isomerizing)
VCGIIGCTSDEDVVPAVLGGLKRVEYRGYDSAGIVVIDGGRFDVRKGAGRIEDVEKRVRLSSMRGRTGLGHTRWATHGSVSDRNAHPHVSCNDEVAVVHNGIIDNYIQLKEELIKKGHKFRSDTDTEVIAHLVEEELKARRDYLHASLLAFRKLSGQYAAAMIFKDRPDLIVGARKDAPLVLGVGKGKNFIASDAVAFIEHTDKAIFLDNMELAEIRPESIRVYRIKDGREVRKNTVQLAWEVADITKKEHAHFTLKEIHEQPLTVRRAFFQEKTKLVDFASSILNAKSVFITGAGTSFHASMLMAYRLRNEARIKPENFLAGEYRQFSKWFEDGSVVVVFSQSGETADVLEAIRDAKKNGARIISIVNSVGSTLARESDIALPLNCGPEIGVAATKSFTAQVVLSNLVVDTVLQMQGKMMENGINEKEGEILSRAVERALECENQIKGLVSMYSNKADFYFVARGYSYPVALEGALKLKELSYIHAEGMPASELKHGTLALIEEGTPVVAVNPSGENHSDTLSNVEEMIARGAHVIGISDEASKQYTHFIKVPKLKSKQMPVVEVVPLQLLAYYMAVERENDPDYPRNLAKSVTVK